MKSKFKKSAVLVLTAILAGTAFSCGKDKKEDISDSQVSDDNVGAAGTIKLATMYAHHDQFYEAVKNFEESSGYNVEIIDYYEKYHDANSDAEGENIIKGACDLLRKDMVSGRCPDIVCAEPSFMSDIADGYFTDLYALMDGSSVSRDDFLPNVLKGFERGGKLPMICTGVQFETAVAPTEIVGEDAENWSYSDARAAIDSLPEETNILGFSQYPINDLSGYMNEMLMHEVYINGIDDFKSTYLDNCDFLDRINITDDWEGEELEGNFFISEVVFWGINSGISQQLYYTLSDVSKEINYDISDTGKTAKAIENDLTFVGFPSSNGIGISIMYEYATEMYGILENSENKKAAWDLLSGLFDVDYQTEMTVCESGGIPVIDAAIDKAMEYTKWNSHSINSPFMTADGTEYYMGEEMKQQVADYIRRVELRPYYDTELDSIFREENLAVLAGEKSAEEAADMIENRYTLYSAEKS